MTTRHALIALLSALVAFGGLGCGQEDAGDAEHADSSAAAAFCEEHQIAEAQCPYCDPSLIESLGFCHGHGVPEAFCYLCNPALIPAFKAVGDWCAGHDRPESQCYICNPQLDPALDAAPATETLHGSVGSDRGSSSDAAPGRSASRTQQAPSATCATQNLIIRFENHETAAQAGLELATVEFRSITKTLECNAEIAYDGNRYARISALVPGLVAALHKEPGDSVAPGEALATIMSTHLGAAKASYLQAAAAVELWQGNHAREKDLLDRGVSTERDMLEAETRLTESRISLSEAEQALISFGLSRVQIEGVLRSDDTSAHFTVTAPFQGIVVDRRATIGEVVDPSRPLFTVADVSRMWVLIDVYESDLRDIQVGQPVVVRAEGLGHESFAGRIDWVSSQLDPQTRTLQARAELDNSRGLLRAHMFAQASVSVRDGRQSLVVPAESVQWEGCCNVVFVKQSETVYIPHKVHLGTAADNVYEVLSGVEEGAEIVSQGSFLLKTEILKGSIGAGCCEVDPGA